MGAEKVLMGMTTNELREVACQLGLPPFAGKQMAQWMYGKHVTSIDEMTNLSKTSRELLARHYCVGAMPPAASRQSSDGTVKYLFPVRCSSSSTNSQATTDSNSRTDSNGKQTASSPHIQQRYVETVFIPDGDRATLCVSSQVGCKMNCLFCQTGKQGWQGNLTAADILNQVYSLPERNRLTNIVFMGQGEPMDNLDAVLCATEILTAADGYAWSPKRITVSSVGVRGKLKRFLDESQCHVAISLHSPQSEQRLRLMPAEKAMPIEETVALLRQYDFTHQRRCSFEYICFAGLNDTPAHAREIVRLLSGLECRINLIRFHQIPGVDLPGSDEQRMEQMRDTLTRHGITTTIRASRGEDVLAACGMLSTAYRQLNEGNGD